MASDDGEKKKLIIKYDDLFREDDDEPVPNILVVSSTHRRRRRPPENQPTEASTTAQNDSELATLSVNQLKYKLSRLSGVLNVPSSRYLPDKGDKIKLHIASIEEELQRRNNREMAQAKLSLKLLVDSKANKVLFAEAGKDFVDFLIHILSLPVGTVVKLLNESGMVGSVGSLYKSVESLSSDYFEANVNKDAVLKPKAAVNVSLLGLNDGPPPCYKLYKCSGCFNYGSHDPSISCPGCGSKICTAITYVPPSNTVNVGTSSNPAGGFVKGLVRYMVMDNLEVKPLSSIPVITLMNKFNVKDVSAVVEKEVQVGFTEGLAMLKASFEITNSVLTTVFLIKEVQ